MTLENVKSGVVFPQVSQTFAYISHLNHLTLSFIGSFYMYIYIVKENRIYVSSVYIHVFIMSSLFEIV